MASVLPTYVNHVLHDPSVIKVTLRSSFALCLYPKMDQISGWTGPLLLLLLLFIRSVMSDSLQRHGLQHTRPPCPSPTQIQTHTHGHQVGDAIRPSHPLLPSFLLSSMLLSITIFTNVWALHIRWPKHWSFSFSISPSNEYSGLISFRID